MDDDALDRLIATGTAPGRWAAPRRVPTWGAGLALLAVVLVLVLVPVILIRTARAGDLLFGLSLGFGV